MRLVSSDLHNLDDVRAWLAANVYGPAPDAPVLGKVGLEAEFFPFWLARHGGPAARLALVEIVGIVDDIRGAVRNPESHDGRPSWQLDGALITEEPGAQIEVAGPPEVDAGTAIVNLEQVIDRVSAAFAAAGAGLAAAGLDCWSRPGDVPVQLDVARYQAMTTYFQRRGDPSGHLMMCSSCSLQVNVDLGPPAIAADRWLLVNLAAPVLIAAFAASPGEQVVNARALGWRRLDPTRTGVPPPLVAGVDDPLEHALADVMRADVLLVERDGRAQAGEPGWTFGAWLADPHPAYGRPTADDLATHLTTLFPESRLRGFLEVRSIDELPAPWRVAAVVLVVGLLYDDEAVHTSLELLRPHRSDIPELLERAARAGLGDPLLGRLAVDVLEAAYEGAVRLGIPQADQADAFLHTFTRQGRHPSDELRAARAEGPAPAFTWSRA